ncbi:MAG: hypothetical protein DCC55_11665 [Chloroflexi bacterium]|nr:MAG: hypothetical protein DCC55_11665 [Chloroflexota bacterium]
MTRIVRYFRTYLERVPAQGPALRTSLFTCLLCLALVSIILSAPVAAGNFPSRPLSQDSPLSPLAAPATSEPPALVATTTPPISLVLVGAVLAGVLFVIGLVIWRR